MSGLASVTTLAVHEDGTDLPGGVGELDLLTGPPAREASLQTGTHFVLTGARPALCRLLAITGLEDVFEAVREHGAISPDSASWR
ncbi:hypothetical protein ABTX60_28510 [Streptomyces sp. NPDC126510]|uniref:hypothetical protein n=1 Tax=Streptomyces sp. NPDC126510 TaxID=3155317 RepID=UPI00332C068E